MEGFVCSPLRDFDTDAECEIDDQKAEEFYKDSSIKERTNNCLNYFDKISTVAKWPVSRNINWFATQRKMAIFSRFFQLKNSIHWHLPLLLIQTLGFWKIFLPKGHM